MIIHDNLSTSSELRAVMSLMAQSAQGGDLFCVVANADVFLDQVAIPYQLLPTDEPALQALQVPLSVVEAVFQALAPTAQPFATEQLFVRCIGQAAGAYLPDFLRVPGRLTLEMAGSTFQLAPRAWRQDPATPTLLIAKFRMGSLQEQVERLAQWTWPAVATPANGTLVQTQAVLLQLLADAAQQPGPLFDYFNGTVANDPDWMGFLCLNVPVQVLTLLDNPLVPLAGSDYPDLYAHHVGVVKTPLPGSLPVGQDVAALPILAEYDMFGVVDYTGPFAKQAAPNESLKRPISKLQMEFLYAEVKSFTVEPKLS